MKGSCGRETTSPMSARGDVARGERLPGTAKVPWAIFRGLCRNSDVRSLPPRRGVRVATGRKGLDFGYGATDRSYERLPFRVRHNASIR